jgi:predicted dehydrogenase
VKKLTIGIIGGGKFFDYVHAPALDVMKGIGRKVLCCLDEKRARHICKKWGYQKYYLDIDGMFSHEKLDAVYAITPPAVTGQIALKAIKNGVPAFLEKPVAEDFKTLSAIQRAFRKHKTPHFIAFNRRHIPLVLAAKQYLKKHGPASHIAVDFYRHNTKAPSPFMGSGVHAVDTIRFLCGDVKSVLTVKSRRVYFDKKAVSYSSLLKFASGITGVFNYHCRAGYPSEQYRLFFENGTLVLELSRPEGAACPKKLSIFRGLKLVYHMDLLKMLSRRRRTPAYLNGIVDEHRYFLECLRRRKHMESDIHESVKTMRLAKAINANLS